MPNPNSKKGNSSPSLPDELTFYSLSPSANGQEREDSKEDTGEYVQTKGIDVLFLRSGGDIVEGKLVKWDDPERFVVVAVVGDKILKKEISAAKLFSHNPDLRKKIERLSTSAETRGQLTSLFEDYHQDRTIKEPTIDNGGTAETLGRSLRTFTFPGGIEGAAATSVAGAKFDPEKSDLNEDRWYVNPKTGFAAVVDATGGGKSGSLTAKIVTEILADCEDNLDEAPILASNALKKHPGIGKKDSACYMTAKLKVNQRPELSQCGDVDFYHFSAEGEVKYAPGQQMEMGQGPQSSFEFFEQLSRDKAPRAQVESNLTQIASMAIDKMTEKEEAGLKRIIARIVSGEFPIVETDNPMYVYLRKVPVRGISKQWNTAIHFKTNHPLKAGDWVVMVSDGVSDNLPEGELEAFIRKAIAQGWTPEEATRELSGIIDLRMKLKAAKNPRAMKKHYKLDNATIFIARVKEQSDSAKTDVKTA